MSIIPLAPPLPNYKVAGITGIVPDRDCEAETLKTINKCFTALKSGKPKLQAYVHLAPVIQEGPTCGLVALSMISNLTPKPLSVSQLLDVARLMGFSCQGEMFSVHNMTSLISQTLHNWFDIVEYTGGLNIRREQIISDLMQGILLLVPYDADKNHAPTCLKGHKAHWAILCGVLSDSEYCVVLARQGKSKHIGVWSFNELHNSNCNLREIDPERIDGEYVLNDINKELAGKYIALFPKEWGERSLKVNTQFINLHSGATHL